MSRLRLVTALLLTFITLGALAGTSGYAWYLRSDRYRRSCSARLSEAVGLPSEIGRVVPLSWSAREFHDIQVWLPGRRDLAMTCRRAILTQTPTPADPDAYELELVGGRSEISTRTWLREDYRRIIESGLRPGFDPDGPRRVRFREMDLELEREQFRGTLEDTTGEITFETGRQATAVASCRRLNGFTTAEPTILHARFSPATGGGVRIDEVVLEVPALPVRVLDLWSVTGLAVEAGLFSGRLQYMEDGAARLCLSGRCEDLHLAEWTAAWLQTPVRGTCPEAELSELCLVDGRLERLRFRGALTDLRLGDLLRAFGFEDAGGDLTLRIREALITRAGIERLIASGSCDSLSLAALTKSMPGGGMSGTARLVIEDMTIEQNHLRSLDAEVHVQRAGEETWVSGATLTELLSQWLRMKVPLVLPPRIEYSRLGIRLEVRDELLHAFGTHGPRNKTILTADLFGNEMPLIQEPERGFDLRPVFNAYREEWLARLRARLGPEWARPSSATPPTAQVPPSTTPAASQPAGGSP